MFRHQSTLLRARFIASILFACLALALVAQAQNASLPSPRDVLGFTPGDDRTIADWRQITDYFNRLAQASNRVRVEQIGLTTLKRPQIVAYISAAENIRDLEKYKTIQHKLADPRLVKSDAERDQLIRDGKTVVVISCSIHSSEIVASQMSMQLAYELAAAQDAETLRILQNTILILIPSPNPDGVDIIADWYRKTLGTKYEGTEPPELYHYYAGHDDNRDWFMMNLRETRNITRLFWKEWFPEIVYDVHQQGATGSRFFVPPFYDPPNPRIAPYLLREVGLLGYKIAADLQAAGQKGVITNALYDTWWHGGFRTAPYFHNSIGILTEAASARLMSPVTVTREQLARSQTRGMPSALQSATNFPEPWTGGEWHPRDIMRMELSAARSVLSLAANYRADYLRNFYELGHQAIVVQPINQTEKKANSEFELTISEPEAYLIPAGQGHDENVAKLIGALVEQGVEVYRLERELHIATISTVRTMTPASYDPKGNRQFINGQAFHIEPPIEKPAGSYIVFLRQPYRANVQSLFERQFYPDRRAENGAAERPYDVTGWTLPMQMNVKTEMVADIREPESERKLTLIHDENEVRRDFGLKLRTSEDASPIENPLKRPVRLGLYKSWTGSMDEGWTRYVFDIFNVPYASVRDAEMRAGDLRSKYDVIILPSMRLREIVEGNNPNQHPAEFAGGITDAGVENLRRFVEAGGTLICFDAACELAIERFKLPLRNVLQGIRTSEFYCPGSILRLTVDTSNPIARGFAKDVDAYFINSSAFETVGDTPNVRVIARYADRDVLQSGWLLGEKYLAGKIALAEVEMGKGRVVLFGFRPQHRGQTWGTFPFIFNAIERR
jgi:hypothetical protein